jgi:hypothetical protein
VLRKKNTGENFVIIPKPHSILVFGQNEICLKVVNALTPRKNCFESAESEIFAWILCDVCTKIHESKNPFLTFRIFNAIFRFYVVEFPPLIVADTTPKFAENFPNWPNFTQTNHGSNFGQIGRNLAKIGDANWTTYIRVTILTENKITVQSVQVLVVVPTK